MGSVGIDLGGSSVKAVRLDEGAAPRERSRVPLQAPTLEAIGEAVSRAAASVGARPDDRLGACAPGRVDPRTGVILYAANLPCLQGVEPALFVAEHCGISRASVVLTDAAASGLGAWHAAPVEGRLLTLAMGTGVGAAVVEEGRLLTLDGVGPGHVGQIDVSAGEPDAPVGPDGGRGSLEAYVGGPALTARFGRDGVAEAVAVLSADDPVVRALTRALRICHAVYRPNEMRLVGGAAPLFEPLVPLLHRLVSDGLTGVARRDWRLGVMDDPFLAACGAASAARGDARSSG